MNIEILLKAQPNTEAFDKAVDMLSFLCEQEPKNKIYSKGLITLLDRLDDYINSIIYGYGVK